MRFKTNIKMKHVRTIMGVLVACAALSCTKIQNGTGQVAFTVTPDESVVECTKSNISDYTSLPVSADFTIVVKSSESEPVYNGKLSGWDSATKLKAGAYTVNVTYGDIEEEGFNKPYFYGESNFTVVADQTAQVSVPARLGNTIIKVSCTDNFKKYYSDYSFRLLRSGAELVTFVKDDTRAAFIDGYMVTLKGELRSESKTYTFTKEYSGLNEATAYTILFDVSNVGGTNITISFNENIDQVDLGEIDLNE
jgi:hypothetical protein